MGCRIDPKGPSNIYIYTYICIYIFETTKTYCKLVLGPYVWNLREILILTQPIRIRHEVAIVDPHICWNAGILQPAMLNYPLKQVDQSVFCSKQILGQWITATDIWSKVVVLSAVAGWKSHGIWATKQKARGQKRSPDEIAPQFLPCNKIDNWRGI